MKTRPLLLLTSFLITCVACSAAEDQRNGPSPSQEQDLTSMSIEVPAAAGAKTQRLVALTPQHRAFMPTSTRNTNFGSVTGDAFDYSERPAYWLELKNPSDARVFVVASGDHSESLFFAYRQKANRVDDCLAHAFFDMRYSEIGVAIDPKSSVWLLLTLGNDGKTAPVNVSLETKVAPDASLPIIVGGAKTGLVRTTIAPRAGASCVQTVADRRVALEHLADEIVVRNDGPRAVALDAWAEPNAAGSDLGEVHFTLAGTTATSQLRDAPNGGLLSAEGKGFAVEAGGSVTLVVDTKEYAPFDIVVRTVASE